MVARLREPIASPSLSTLPKINPLEAVQRIAGVRIYDVGQGDAVAILGRGDGQNSPVFQLDYGGKERSPFENASDVDNRLPIGSDQLLMLSHWDEDHWCAARRGTQARNAHWLVPRQITSPRAVKFSTKLPKIHCLPEKYVGKHLKFESAGGDIVMFEKIGSFPGPYAKTEDCNQSGIALAVLRRRRKGFEVILLPGDAPFHEVGMYQMLLEAGYRLRGILAFHHGANTHWTDKTRQMLANWPLAKTLDVVFSCSRPSSYDHPHKGNYTTLLPKAAFHETADFRAAKLQHFDILF